MKVFESHLSNLLRFTGAAAFLIYPHVIPLPALPRRLCISEHNLHHLHRSSGRLYSEMGFLGEGGGRDSASRLQYWVPRLLETPVVTVLRDIYQAVILSADDFSKLCGDAIFTDRFSGSLPPLVLFFLLPPPPHPTARESHPHHVHQSI